MANRLYLSVPYPQRDEAKALGCKWDKERKRWWLESDADRAQIPANWLVESAPIERTAAHQAMSAYSAERPKWAQAELANRLIDLEVNVRYGC